MKFVCDHTIDRRIARRLATFGHAVEHASDLFPDGTPDVQLSRYADADGAIVLTRGKDFSDSWILKRSPRKVVLMRSFDQRQLRLLEALILVLPTLARHFRPDGDLFFEYTTRNEWVYHLP